MLEKMLRVIYGIIAVSIAAEAAATEPLRSVIVTTNDALVRLYDAPDGASTATRPKVGFPDRVYVLGESATGRLKIRFADTGQTVWVRGRDVKLMDGPLKSLECDPVTRPSGPQSALAAQTTRGVRGAGGGECR
jgi:hypothetical protein